MTNRYPRIIAIIVALCGVAVMFGWVYDITFLKSILPNFVTMKFITAVCFVLSGTALYFAARTVEDGKGWDNLVLLFINFLVALLMASLVISVFFGIKTGLEDLFVKESAGAINTTVPGRPALITAINFILIAVMGSLSLFRKERSLKIVHVLGVMVAVSGGVAMVGYLADVPVLYYNIDKISTAMAIHTAILFVLLGAGFYTIREGGGASSEQ